MQDKAICLSDLLKEDQVIFFIGNETKPSIMETLGHLFRDLNFDHVMNALWSTEHHNRTAIAPGVRTFSGKLVCIDQVKVAIGISKQVVKGAAAEERLFFMFLAPYGKRFQSRALVRAVSRLFQKPNLVARLSKLWSPTDVLQALRDAEGRTLPRPSLSTAA